MSILPIAIALVLGIGCIAGIVILVVNRRSDLTYEARRRASREKGVLARGGEADAEAPADEADDAEGEGDEASPEDKVAGDEDD
jgi:hypothetical protein